MKSYEFRAALVWAVRVLARATLKAVNLNGFPEISKDLQTIAYDSPNEWKTK